MTATEAPAPPTAAPAADRPVVVDDAGHPAGRLASLTAGITTILQATVLLGLTWAAMAPVNEAYAGGPPFSLLAGAFLGILVSLAVARAGLPAAVSAVAAAVVVAAYVGAVTSDDVVAGFLPTPASLVDVWRGATAGWRDLLTVGLPAEPEGDLLAGPLALAVLCGWSTTEFGRRTRVGALALLPPVLTLAVTMAVSASAARPSVLTSVALVALALTWLAMRAALPAGGEGGLGSLGQWLVFAAPIVAGLTVAGVLVGVATPLTDPDERFDLRDHVEQPVVVRDDISPLARIAGQLDPDVADTELFTVTFSRLPRDLASLDFLPVAVLDTYDGALWTTSASFVRPGRELPAPVPVGGEPVSAAVSLASYRSSFLPFLPHATSLRGRDLGYDQSTGALITDARTLSGFTYSIAGPYVPAATLRDRAVDANPAGGDAVAPLLEVADELPPAIEATVDRIENEASTTFNKLDLLESIVQDEPRGYTSDARSGHSLGRLDRFLGSGDDPVARNIGTAEQGAAVFAVVARALGVPSRVVVGYQLAGVTPNTPLPVKAGTITARAEVLLADVGWVPFAARPLKDVQAPDEKAKGTLPGETDAATGELEDAEQPTSGTIPPPVQPVGGNAGGGFPWGIVVAALVLFAALGAGPVGKRVRRRRRRSGAPPKQILGAGAELRDRLVERGVPAPYAWTFHDIIVAKGGGLPETSRQAAEQLGPLVDRALYAEVAPEVPDAARAWRLESDFVRGLAGHEGALTRLRCLVDPRPLVVRPPKRAAPMRDRTPPDRSKPPEVESVTVRR